MNLESMMGITSRGLAVQQDRMRVIAENLANANSTSTPEGGPYRHKSSVIVSEPLRFESSLRQFLKVGEVQVPRFAGVVQTGEPKRVYDPTHPDADKAGFVSMPNISVMQEMVDMMTASRTYEANVAAFNATKSMALRTFEIGAV